MEPVCWDDQIQRYPQLSELRWILMGVKNSCPAWVLSLSGIAVGILHVAINSGLIKTLQNSDYANAAFWVKKERACPGSYSLYMVEAGFILGLVVPRPTWLRALHPSLWLSSHKLWTSIKANSKLVLTPGRQEQCHLLCIPCAVMVPGMECVLTECT